MRKSALIVIDVQESFRHRPFWSESDLPAFLASQQALIDGCVARGVPVVQIFHVGQDTFAPENGHVRTLDGLTIAPDVVFHKQHHSAFAGTELASWLTAHGINRLIVSGIRTEQCCETTTRYASDVGFQIDFVTDATLTFAMTHARSGRTYSSAEIRERTELVLEGRFARIASVDTALAALAA